MALKLSIFLGFSLTAFVVFRVLPEIRAHRNARKMEPDNLGNYDLDGVSYDPEAHTVVVTGDSQAPEPVPDLVVVEEVVTLHAPEEPRERSVGA
jgi:hypothetical protein